MKSLAKLVSFGAVLLAVCICSSACEQSNLGQTKRARLVANENLELKEHLRLRDKEIQKQKDLLAKCRQKSLDIEKKTGESTIKLMEILSETGKTAEKLTAENQLLKAEIAKLKERIAQAHDN